MYNALSGSVIIDETSDDEEELYVDEDPALDEDLAGPGSHTDPDQVGTNKRQSAATVLKLAMEAMMEQEQQMRAHKLQHQQHQLNIKSKSKPNKYKRPAKKGISPKSKKQMAEDIDAISNSNSPCQSKADCCSSDAANEEDIATSNSPLSTTPPSIGKSIKPSMKSVTSTASTVNKNRTNAAMDLTELDAASSAEISEILNHLFSGHELNKSIPPPPPLSAEAKEACHRMAASSSPTNQSLYSMIVKNKLIAEDDVLAIDDDTPTTSKKAAAIAAARKATTATATADVNNNTNVIDNSKLGAVNANHSPPVDGANFYANDIEIDDDDEDDDDHDQNEGFLDRLKKKPTPLYLHNVPEIMPVLLDINKVIGENNYYTKPTAGHGLRIQCANIAVYRQLAHHFKQNNIESHTYQLQADRGFRFMIRHLHHSTPDAWIRQQLTNLGHKVRYVSVIKKRFTRQPLNMFEVEIAAESSSLNVLDITCLGGQKVKVEKILRNADAVQCHRCQKFGHTKNYCRRPFVCVKCSGSHPSTECERKKGASSQPPPKCANCQGEHAASYRGCKSYKDACRLKSSAAKGHQLASKMVADLARNRSDNAASMAMTIKQHLCNANAVKQPQMPLQQQQQQRKQPQMPRQQQQLIKVNNLSKQQLPQQPLKNIKPYPKKQSQSTLLSYADALKANHHPVQLNQPIARQQPQPQEALRQKLPYDDVSTDASTNYKYESRQRGDVNTSTDQKLDILISLMLEERKRPAAPVVNSNNSSSNLEEKIDKLINMIGLLATHLMKDKRI